MMPDTSNVARYTYMQEIVMGNVEKLWLNWKFYFFVKVRDIERHAYILSCNTKHVCRILLKNIFTDLVKNFVANKNFDSFFLSP